MTTQKMNTAAQEVINFKLNNIKFNVRRNYRQASEIDRLSSAWMNNLSKKVNKEILEILNLTDGRYSAYNIAVAAMNGKKIKAKIFA